MEKENTNFVKKSWKKSTIKIAAGFFLAAGIGLGTFFYKTNYAVDSIIYLDENSQNSSMAIEIQVNQKEKVLKVNAKDAVSQAIVGERDFRGSSLDITIDALFASMLQNSMLQNDSFRENENAITVRVKNKDITKGQQLQNELISEVNGFLQEQNTVEPNLAIAPTSSEIIGGVGENSVIGEAKAKSIAFSHASVQEDMVTQSYIKLDDENGIRVYEMEFYAGGYEYDYEINALTGEIVSQKKEKESNSLMQANNKSSNNPQITENLETEGSYIAEADAKTTAFTHAGVAADQVWLEKCKLDYEDGIMVYEMEFYAGGYEYDYEINALTGEIVSQKKEKKSNSLLQANPNKSSNNPQIMENLETEGSYIAEADAKTTAFTHAGVAADQVWLEKCKLDYEDGIMIYEMEFYADGYEYEYEIDARTGKVIQFKKEVEDNHNYDHHHNSTTLTDQNNGNSTTSYISEWEAREIAISHAGLKGINNPIVEIKLEEEDGIMVYEVEMLSGGYEHKCEIHAVTGEVLSYEREWDD